MELNDLIGSRDAVCGFYSVERVCGGRGGEESVEPQAFGQAPDGVRASQKNERIALNENKSMVPNVKISGQPMTSEVRSNTRNGPLDMTILRTLQNRI